MYFIDCSRAEHLAVCIKFAYTLVLIVFIEEPISAPALLTANVVTIATKTLKPRY